MTIRTAITETILWVFVLLAGLVAGGALFEHTVLTPLWAAAPPESVVAWKYGAIQGRFFARVTPLYGLFGLAMLIVAWMMPWRRRVWALVAGACAITTLIWTLVFFIPILGKTQETGGAGLTGEEITRLTNQFAAWSWVRWAVVVVSWISAMRALTMRAGHSESWDSAAQAKSTE